MCTRDPGNISEWYELRKGAPPQMPFGRHGNSLSGKMNGYRAEKDLGLLAGLERRGLSGKTASEGTSQARGVRGVSVGTEALMNCIDNAPGRKVSGCADNNGENDEVCSRAPEHSGGLPVEDNSERTCLPGLWSSAGAD